MNVKGNFMKFRKFISLLLVVSMICILALSFTACESTEGSDSNDATNGDSAGGDNASDNAPTPVSSLKAAETGDRNDYNGSVGYEFVCSKDVTVSSVGRPLNGEMNQSHTIYIWEVGLQTCIAFAEVKPDSPLDGLGFKTAELNSPVVLKAGEAYRVVSTEYMDGDKWYDVGTSEEDPIPDLQPTDDFQIITPAFTGENEHDVYPANEWNPGGIRGYVGVTLYYVPYVAAAE